MAVIFKRLPDQRNGRRRYTATIDTAGRSMPRKKQMTTEHVMQPKYIIGPTYMPGGADRNAPYAR